MYLLGSGGTFHLENTYHTIHLLCDILLFKENVGVMLTIFSAIE
jgi:hypothetical protein